MVINLNWSCNESPDHMDNCDPSHVYFTCTSSSDYTNAKLSIFSLKDILAGKDDLRTNMPIPVLVDEFSHLCPIKALAWNPIKRGLLATGGSTNQDSVIRIYDMNNLSK